MEALEEKFLNALKSSESQNYEESLKAFEGIISENPSGDLADDALFNIGILHFKQNKFDEAEKSFRKVISDFPGATIAEFENSVEHGMTTAKALLGLINCSLAMGDEVSAWDSLDKLNEFENSSFVMFTDPSGVTFKKTYRMLGQELLDQYAATKQELE